MSNQVKVCSAIFIKDLYVVCLYKAQISSEGLQDNWSSGLLIRMERNAHITSILVYGSVKCLFCFKLDILKVQEVPQ